MALSFLLWAPLFFALLGALLGRRMAPKVALFGSAVTLGMAIYYIADFDTGKAGLQHVTDTVWIAALGIHYKLGVDGLNLFLLTLTTLLWCVATLYAYFRSWDRPQLFFFFMVLHLWGQYFMAGWRQGRAATWMIGVVIFGISVLTAFTGYLSQQNFASQFIAINAKDAMNGAGIGAFFNVLNFGQMYGLHVMLLPIGVTILVVIHIVLVRTRGVVKPIDPTVLAGLIGSLRLSRDAAERPSAAVVAWPNAAESHFSLRWRASSLWAPI